MSAHDCGSEPNYRTAKIRLRAEAVALQYTLGPSIAALPFGLRSS